MAREQAFLAPAAAELGGRGIPSPFQFLFSGEDNLRLMVVNSLAGVTITIDGRYLPIGGTPQAFTQTATPTADRTANEFNFGFGTGYLLNCSAIITAGASRVGQTYVMLQIIRGLSGAKLVLGCLFSGYVTAQQHVAYPGSPILTSTTGPGVLRFFAGTQPAAGAELLETVPTGARWKVISIYTTLTTSATVADRRSILIFDSSTLNHFIMPAVSSIPASNAIRLNWARGVPIAVVIRSDPLVQGLPTETILLEGHRIRTETPGMQAGDQYSAPNLMVEELLEVA